MTSIGKADDADDVTDIAILCQICCDNGNWDTMWPSAGHDDEPHFGVATIEAGDEDCDVARERADRRPVRRIPRRPGIPRPRPPHGLIL